MTKRNLLGIAAVAALAASPLIAPGQASAANNDAHAYHSSGCQAMDGIETDYNRSEYRITRTGGSSSGQLLCPVNRDHYECGNIFGGCVIGTTARVKVADVTTQGRVSCSLSARTEDGYSSYYSTDATSYGLAVGVDTLVMSVQPPVGNGTYSLRCEMPTNNSAGYTKIYGYKIEE